MLEVSNLSVEFRSASGAVKAVDNVGFTLDDREIVGLLGESGSGKSTVGLALLRLVPPPGRIVTGQIYINGKDIMKLREKHMPKVRGAVVSMIFQDPFSSLDPVYTVGDQIAETLQLHRKLKRKEALAEAAEMLDVVKIKDPQKRMNDYPHQFSGGMRQRAMIAMALACRPAILIADEPTTALDVTVQAGILDLLREMNEKFGISILYITHNFAVASHLCRRALVMQKGKIIESGKMRDILAAPEKPYTRRLIASLKELES
ncbi:MAG TPA: ABC transporter ATP-binding protein [Candidatus Omnitrophota bacterium]|nr:ABC transporter ATP-binding protein [Candidatus Omnitrophota bacterium]